MANYARVLQTTETETLFTFDEVVSMRDYINAKQGGGFYGTVIGMVGLLFPPAIGLAIGVASSVVSVGEIITGNNLEEQEDFYTDIMSLLGTPTYDLAKVKQKMAYVMVTDGGGNLLKEGWTLYDKPVLSELHTDNGWVVIA